MWSLRRMLNIIVWILKKSFKRLYIEKIKEVNKVFSMKSSWSKVITIYMDMIPMLLDGWKRLLPMDPAGAIRTGIFSDCVCPQPFVPYQCVRAWVLRARTALRTKTTKIDYFHSLFILKLWKTNKNSKICRCRSRANFD